MKSINWYFSALCCERLLPNYLAFQQAFTWGRGDVQILRQGLDYVWQYLETGEFDAEKITQLHDQCVEIIPNSETSDIYKNPDIYITIAQNACFGICGILDVLIRFDPERNGNILSHTVDTVILYTDNSDIKDEQKSNNYIFHHPLMQRELKIEDESLTLLEKTPEITPDFLVKFKKLWDNDGKSNLDLSAD
ncbi:MAG: DUF416 family protein [Pseudomonadota bacterium]